MTTKIDALLGAISGDIIGSAYEFRGVEAENFKIFDEHCSYTIPYWPLHWQIGFPHQEANHKNSSYGMPGNIIRPAMDPALPDGACRRILNPITAAEMAVPCELVL